jgi:phage shock protein PspC (stress-responsive transcriptional regulator)
MVDYNWRARFFWVITTTAGWGIGIAAHFISVFVIREK